MAAVPDRLDLSMDVNVSGTVGFADAVEIVETVSFREVECHYETEEGINGYAFDSGAAAAAYLRALAGDREDYRQEGWQYVVEKDPGPLERREAPYEVYTGLPGPEAVAPGQPELRGLGLASNRIGYTLEVPLDGDGTGAGDRTGADGRGDADGSNGGGDHDGATADAGASERVHVRNWFDMEATYDEVDKLDVMYDLLSDLHLSTRL